MGSRKFSQNIQGQPDPKGAKMRKQGHLQKKKSGTRKCNVTRKLKASPGTVITLYKMIKIKIRNTGSPSREAY